MFRQIIVFVYVNKWKVIAAGRKVIAAGWKVKFDENFTFHPAATTFHPAATIFRPTWRIKEWLNKKTREGKIAAKAKKSAAREQIKAALTRK